MPLKTEERRSTEAEAMRVRNARGSKRSDYAEAVSRLNAAVDRERAEASRRSAARARRTRTLSEIEVLLDSVPPNVIYTR